jgi:hypothetical protein
MTRRRRQKARSHIVDEIGQAFSPGTQRAISSEPDLPLIRSGFLFRSYCWIAGDGVAEKSWRPFSWSADLENSIIAPLGRLQIILKQYTNALRALSAVPDGVEAVTVPQFNIEVLLLRRKNQTAARPPSAGGFVQSQEDIRRTNLKTESQGPICQGIR